MSRQPKTDDKKTRTWTPAPSVLERHCRIAAHLYAALAALRRAETETRTLYPRHLALRRTLGALRAGVRAFAADLRRASWQDSDLTEDDEAQLTALHADLQRPDPLTRPDPKPTDPKLTEYDD